MVRVESGGVGILGPEVSSSYEAQPAHKNRMEDLNGRLTSRYGSSVLLKLLIGS